MKAKQNQEVREVKKADLEMLELAAGAGEICLKYLDESGFSLWAETVYSWGKIGEQKKIEQPKKRGKRVNICGLLEKGRKFDYGLALKSFKSESYIKLMDWQANQAQARLLETGKITVVVQDQASIHVSRQSREKWSEWEGKGLYIFLLPSYSSELNAIEIEWQRIKEDELAGRMFEDEYDLVLAVIEAIDKRETAKGLDVERFHFASSASFSLQNST